MIAIADKIIKRVRGKGRGWAFTPKDFLDLGARGSIDVALGRLVQHGHIRRLGRGLYDYPKINARLGALSPDIDLIAQAIATQGGDRIARSGAQAANRMGLSTQVPAKINYATSGRSRIKKVAGRIISLTRSRVPILDTTSPNANAVLQLLSHLGKAEINDDLIKKCAARLAPHDLKALKKAQAAMPGWLSDAVFRICSSQHG